MSRRSEYTKSELRKRIVDATQNLVIVRGSRNVHARQIATAVGYTPGMLYSVFVNLNDIFSHVNARSIQALVSDCEKATIRTSTAEDALHSICKAYLAFAVVHTNEFELLFDKRFYDRKLEVLEDARGKRDAFFSLIHLHLKRLSPDATDMQLEVGSRSLWASAHGIAVLQLQSRLFLTPPHSDVIVLEHLVGCFLQNWQNSEVTTSTA